MLIYYVYAYLRKDGTPYYIGKGKGKRAFSKSHSVFVPTKNSGRIIFLETKLTEVGALAIERRLIRWWGRKSDGGILRNKSLGGEGSTGFSISRKMSNETKRKISESKIGKSYPKLTKANKISGIKRLGIPLSDLTKEKLKISRSTWTFSDEHKSNLSLAQLGKKHPVKSVTCPHCMKTGNPGGMANYHFDNCKAKP